MIKALHCVCVSVWVCVCVWGCVCVTEMLFCFFVSWLIFMRVYARQLFSDPVLVCVCVCVRVLVLYENISFDEVLISYFPLQADTFSSQSSIRSSSADVALPSCINYTHAVNKCNRNAVCVLLQRRGSSISFIINSAWLWWRLFSVKVIYSVRFMTSVDVIHCLRFFTHLSFSPERSNVAGLLFWYQKEGRLKAAEVAGWNENAHTFIYFMHFIWFSEAAMLWSYMWAVCELICCCEICSRDASAALTAREESRVQLHVREERAAAHLPHVPVITWSAPSQSHESGSCFHVAFR